MTHSSWTAERRLKHSLAIRNWAPWKKSTGPRTIAGKAKSCMNALKHGQYCRQAYEFRAALSQRMAYIKFLCHRQDEILAFQRNELLKNGHKKIPSLKKHICLWRQKRIDKSFGYGRLMEITIPF